MECEQQVADQGSQDSADAPADEPVQLTVHVQVHDGCQVLTVAGDIDLSNAQRVDRALLELMRTAEPLVIDLSEVQFMDSMGVRAVVLAQQSAKESGKRLVLVPSAVVAMVFEMAGLDTVLALSPTLAEALALARAS